MHKILKSYMIAKMKKSALLIKENILIDLKMD